MFDVTVHYYEWNGDAVGRMPIIVIYEFEP